MWDGNELNWKSYWTTSGWVEVLERSQESREDQRRLGRKGQ